MCFKYSLFLGLVSQFQIVFSPTMDGYNYDVVEIGDQCWFAENLRTTTYLNGDVIPAGLTNGEWTSTTSGATAVVRRGQQLL